MEENKNNGIQNNGDAIKDLANEGAKIAGDALANGVKMTGKVAGAATRSFLMPVIIVIAVIILGGGIFTGIQLGWFHKELTIDKTANVVEEIKKIGEFTTACYYEEVVMRDTYNDTTSFLGIKSVHTYEIVMIGKGRVRAGFNLAKLQEGDVNAHNDTLEIKLQPAEMFDIIMNPSDFTVVYETGTWSHENTKKVKAQAREQLEKNALNYDILKKAEDFGTKRLELLFTTFGFNEILITIDRSGATSAGQQEVAKVE